MDKKPDVSEAVGRTPYITSVDLLCVTCQQPIKATITTAQWLKVDFISPDGECRSCSKANSNE